MIKFEITSQVIELAPGQPAQLGLTITNQSQLIDHFALRVEPLYTPESAGMDPAWVSLTPATFSLRPAAGGRTASQSESQQSIQVVISLPPMVIAGSYSGRIVVEARSGMENSAVIPLNLIVSEVEDQRLELEPAERISRRGTAIYKVLLSNKGNSAHLYSVYAEDPDDECRFQVTPPEVTLAPNTQTEFLLKVKPRLRNWVDDNKSYGFNVKLEGFDEQVAGTFVQRCALPPVLWLSRRWGALLIAFGVVMALLIAAFIFLLPNFTATAKASFCGPVSTRRVQVSSDNITTQIYVSDRNGADPMNRVVNENAAILPGLFASLVSVSPDGRRLAYVTARNEALDDARIVIIDLETRKQQPLATIPVPSGLWPTAPVWSSDGELIAFSRRPAKAEAAPATTTTAASAGASPAATPSPTATPATPQDKTAKDTSPQQLELWVAKVGEEAKKLGDTNKLLANLFYGDKARIVCWSSDNSAILIHPRTSTKPDDTQTRIEYPEGKESQVALAAPSFPGSNFFPAQLPGQNAMLLPAALSLGLNDLNQTQPTGTNTQTGGGGSAAKGCVLNRPFSQNDPRWADFPLKEGSQARLGDYGCPITGAAMLLNFYGVDTTPSDLSSCLGNLSSPLTQPGWLAIGQQCGSFKLQGGIRGDFSWKELDSALTKGPAIVGMLGGQTGSHFVVVTGGSGGVASSYPAADPWDGSTYKTLEYFLSKGYRPYLLISYDGQSAGCDTGPDTAKDSGISIETKGVNDGGLYRDPQSFRYDVIGTPVFSGTVSLAAVQASADSTNPLPGSEPVTFSQEGNYSIAIKAGGNGTTQSISRSLFFTIDRTPPVASHSISANPDKTGKFTVPVNVTLKATDQLSGISKIEYRINNSDWLLYTSDTTSAPITFKDNGQYTLIYHAIDGAGNVSNDIELPITIELAAANRPAGGSASRPGGVVTTPPAAVATTAAPVAVFTFGPAPTATPRPAVKFTPTPQPVVVTPAITTTATPAGTSLLPGTTTPVATAPIFTPTKGASTTTPLATVTTGPTPTPTVLPKPGLSLSTAQLTFAPGVTSQTIDVSNTGTAPLTWTLLPGTSAQLLTFSLTSGTLLPGAKVTVTINTVAISNLSGQDQVTSFDVKSNAGDQTVGTTIVAQPLPTATFSSPATGEISPTVQIKLAVTVPNQSPAPNHATIKATYKTCANCQPQEVTLPVIPSPDNNWTVDWDTSQFVPQTGMILAGKICSSSDDSVCTDIPALSGLTITMDAVITAPVLNSELPVTTTITVQPKGRAKSASFSAFYQGLSHPITGQTGEDTNWQPVTWSTDGITPDIPSAPNKISLQGTVCSGLNGSGICQSVTSVDGLYTKIEGTVSYSPAIPASNILPDTFSVTVTPTANLNHALLVLTYSDAPGSSPATPHTFLINASNSPAWQVSVNAAATIYAQSGIKAEVLGCYNQYDTICSPIGTSYDNLTLLLGDPKFIYVQTGDGQSTDVSKPFLDPITVMVTDVNNNPIPAKNVTFDAPASGASALFTTAGGVTSSTFVTSTDTMGVAVVPTTAFKANDTVGSYDVIASVTVTGTTTITGTIHLYNNALGALPMSIVSGDGQSIKIGGFYNPFKVLLKDAAGNPAPGVTVTYQVLNGTNTPGGTFPGNSATSVVTSGADGIATSDVLTANLVRGSFTVVASAPGYKAISFTLTNQPGDPNSISIVTPASGAASTPILTNFPQQLQVKVLDAGNYELSNVNVIYSAPVSTTASPIATGQFTSTTGLVSSVKVTTDGTGVATAPVFQANAKASSTAYDVVVSLPDFPAVPTQSFHLTNNVGAPANLGMTADSSTSATCKVNSDCSFNFKVNVTDAGNNSVPGATVSFSAPAANLVTTPPPPTGVFKSNLTNSVAVQTAADGTASTTGLTFQPNCTITNGFPYSSFDLTASLSVSASITKTVPFKVKNIVGDPASIKLVTSPYSMTGVPAAVSLVVNKSLSPNLAVSVIDSCGYPLASQPVKFDVPAYTFDASGKASASSGSFSLTTVQTSLTTSTAISGTTTVNGVNNVQDSGLSVPFTANNLANTIGTNYAITATLLDSTGIAVSGVPTQTLNLRNQPGSISFFTPSPAGPLSATVATKYPTFGVTVQDVFHNPISGLSVSFQVKSSLSASGSFDPVVSTLTTSVTTGADGVANVPAFYANNVAGGPYKVTASAIDPGTGLTTSYDFVMTNLAGSPATLDVNPYNGTTAPVASTTVNSFYPFNSTFTATVKDSFSNPVSNIPVTFTVNFNNGAGGDLNGLIGLTTVTNNTNPQGIVPWPKLFANTKAGTFTLTITAGQIPTGKTVTLENLPEIPDSFDMTTIQGSNQAVLANGIFGNPLSVVVLDKYGNPVSAGNNVIFTAPVSGASGTIIDPVTNTDTGKTSYTVKTTSGGVALVRFKANGIVGNYSVTAALPGIISSSPPTYSLSNTFKFDTANLVGAGQDAIVNNVKFATSLKAKVLDANNNPLTGVNVIFQAADLNHASFGTAGSGISSGLNKVTVASDASGFASVDAFTGIDFLGTYTVTANAADVSGVTAASFSLTNTGTLAPGNKGSGQSAVVNGAKFAKSLVVQVVDAKGVVLSGVDVTFSATDTTYATFAAAGSTASSGKSTFAVKSDVNGYASVDAYSGSSFVGNYTVTAAVTGATTASTASFSLTNTIDLVKPASNATSGDGQVALVNGAKFASPLKVQVVDNQGNGLGGYSVTFNAASSANATFAAAGSSSSSGNSSLAVTSAADGYASVDVYPGSSAGSYSITAQLTSGAGSQFSFKLVNTVKVVATSTPPAKLLVYGETTPLVITVEDANNNPVKDSTIKVGFTVSDTTKASLDSNSVAVSSLDGTASVTLTTASSGTPWGTYSVSASATLPTGESTASLTNGSASFNLTNAVNVATETPAKTTLLINGDSTSLTLRVTGFNGNGVSGVLATFDSTSAVTGNFLTGANTQSASTQSDGRATVNVKSGPKTGSYSVSASIDSTIPTKTVTVSPYSLTNTVSLSTDTNSGSGQSAVVNGAKFGNPLRVIVKDFNGTQVTNVPLTFSVQSSADATFTAASGKAGATTSAAATYDTNKYAVSPSVFAGTSTLGSYNVDVSVNGTSTSIQLSLTNTVNFATAANPATLKNNDSSTTILATAKDNQGTLIPNLTFTFDATSAVSGNFLTGDSTTGNSVTTVNSPNTGSVSATFSKGTATGTYTVTVSVKVATGLTLNKTVNLTNQ
ncbi:MAG TPA: hypothetical protein VH186_27710 [Chloroflexia bacterium]|nr:hypothetical protein [Chloroflexia bacterium]